jgi:hypothetical protein
MSNVEILGRPLYLPIKKQLQDDWQSLSVIKSKPSKSPLTYTDLVYERDVSEENQST